MHFAEIRDTESIIEFRKAVLSFLKPKQDSVLPINDINNIKLLNRPSLNFSHLNQQKFQDNIQGTVDSMC